jgi:protocatechuate 3,4-dioxygenase beta subunit
MNENGIDRRQLLRLIGAGGVALVGAGAAVEGGMWSRIAAFPAPEDAAAASGTSLACVLTPERTEGPYFVDEQLRRTDIRIDPADNSVQAGVPLRLTIRAVDSDRGCAPVRGAAIDVWHCNAQGLYSDEAQNGTSGKKYLRGYQVTDDTGAVEFTTVYPGWYQGRTIHIHFKVRLYDGSRETYELTSQIFFAESLNNTVMALPAYNRGRTRDTVNATDMVYGSDGGELVASANGGASAGYAAVFEVGLAGLPASATAGRSTAKVSAALTKAAFDRTAAGRRRLTATLDVDETVSADLRLVRGGATLAHRKVAALRAGTRRPSLLLANRVAAGRAQLRVTLKDAAGNTKVAKRTVQVPKAA